MINTKPNTTPVVKAERITEFKGADLVELCQITLDAIKDGIGFNWIIPPSPNTLEAYWRGTLVIPERMLIVGRLDGVLAGAAQLIKPPPSKQSQSFAVTLEAHFVAPWARGYGVAKALLDKAEKEAREQGFSVLNLSVRETQEAAIKLYEEAGFTRWGVQPFHEIVGGKMIAGHFFSKNLEPVSNLE